MGTAGGCKPNIDHRKVAMIQALVAAQRPATCQLWPGTLDRKGYGRVWYGGRWRIAHTVVWEVANGPLPDGLTLDHVLMNGSTPRCSKACVNLSHLEPVPNTVNVMRGNGACAQHARQTHCKHGHEFIPENIIQRGNGRECRACREGRYQPHPRIQSTHCKQGHVLIGENVRMGLSGLKCRQCNRDYHREYQRRRRSAA